MCILINNRNIFFFTSKAWWNVKAMSCPVESLTVSMVLSGQQTLRPYSYIKRDTLFRGTINPKHVVARTEYQKEKSAKLQRKP